MYSGLKKLGEAQEEPEPRGFSDLDLITTNYYSPDSGYPAQRISNYDEQLVQHQTLNGNGMSKTATPERRQFLHRSRGVQARTRVGTERNDSARFMQPRFRQW